MTAKKSQPLAVQSEPAPVPVVVESLAAPDLDRTDAEALRARLLAAEWAENKRILQVMAETRAAIAEKQADHEGRRYRWKIAADQARQEYRVAPLPPEQPDTSRERDLLLHLQDQLGVIAQREQKVLGWNLMQVEAAWQEARQELATLAAEHEKALKVLLDKANDWHRLSLDCRRADEQSKGSFVRHGDSDRMRQKLELKDILELSSGVDILEPAPAPTSKVEKITRGEDAAEMRRVNLAVQQQERDIAQGVRRYL